MLQRIAKNLGEPPFGVLLNICHLFQAILCYVSIGRFAAGLLVFLFSALVTMAAMVEVRQAGAMPEALESSKPWIEGLRELPFSPLLGDGLEGESGVAAVLYLHMNKYFQSAVTTVAVFSILAISLLYFKFLRSQTRARGKPLVANDSTSMGAIESQLAPLKAALPAGVALRLGTRTASQISAFGQRSIFLSLHDFVAMRKSFAVIEFKVCHEAYHLRSFDSLFASVSRPIAALSALAASALASILLLLPTSVFLDGMLFSLAVGVLCWLGGAAVYRSFLRGHQDFLSLKELLADRFAAARCGDIAEVLSYFRHPGNIVDGEDHPGREERRIFLETGQTAFAPSRVLTRMMVSSCLFYFIPRWLGVSQIDSVLPGLVLWATLVPFVLCAAATSPHGRVRILPGMAIFLLYLLLTLGLPLLGLWLHWAPPGGYSPVVIRRLEIDFVLFFATPLGASSLRKYFHRGAAQK